MKIKSLLLGLMLTSTCTFAQVKTDSLIVVDKLFVQDSLANTKPLMEYYEDKNKLHKINVNRNVEDIFKDIVDVCND